MKRIISISHNDLDGIACQVILQRYYPLAKKKFYAISYHKFLKTIKKLRRLKNSEIFITDIGFKVDENIIKIFKKWLERNNKIYVIDHHLWKKEEVSQLKNYVTKIYINPKFCASMNLYRFISSKENFYDKPFETILKIVNDVDLWKLKYREISIKWFVVSASTRISKKFLFQKLYSCIFWDEELEQIYQKEMRNIINYVAQVVENFEKHFINLGKYKILLLKLPDRIKHQQTVIAELLREKLKDKEIDVFVFVRSSGGISFRNGTTNKDINLSEIARKLGGGGHKKAAGASLKYNILDKIRFKFTSSIPKKEKIIEIFH